MVVPVCTKTSSTPVESRDPDTSNFKEKERVRRSGRTCLDLYLQYLTNRFYDPEGLVKNVVVGSSVPPPQDVHGGNRFEVDRTPDSSLSVRFGIGPLRGQEVPQRGCNGCGSSGCRGSSVEGGDEGGVEDEVSVHDDEGNFL